MIVMEVYSCGNNGGGNNTYFYVNLSLCQIFDSFDAHNNSIR